MIKRNVILFLTFVATAVFLCGCGAGNVSPINQAAATTSGAGGNPPTATAVMPAATPDVVEDYGKSLTEAQQQYLDNDPEYRQKVDMLNNRIDYLIGGQNRNFAPGSTQLIIKPLWNKDGTLAVPMIQVTDGNGQIVNYANSFGLYNIDVPDHGVVYYIDPNQDPIPLPENAIWDGDIKRIVKLNPTGYVDEFVDSSGKWVKAPTECRDNIENGIALTQVTMAEMANFIAGVKQKDAFLEPRPDMLMVNKWGALSFSYGFNAKGNEMIIALFGPSPVDTEELRTKPVVIPEEIIDCVIVTDFPGGSVNVAINRVYEPGVMRHLKVVLGPADKPVSPEVLTKFLLPLVGYSSDNFTDIHPNATDLIKANFEAANGGPYDENGPVIVAAREAEAMNSNAPLEPFYFPAVNLAHIVKQ